MAVKSKYGAKKIIIDGYKFDSKDEGEYYKALLLRKARGEIQNFEMQPKYTLVPGFKKDGKTYRAITYSPDFLIYHNDGTKELIDVKGFSTQQGELRYKLFNYFYRDEKLTWVARNIKHGDMYGFIDYFELKKIRREAKKGDK